MYGVLFRNFSSFGNSLNFFLACEKIKLSTCLQLYHLTVAIVRVPQSEKGWPRRFRLIQLYTRGLCELPAATIIRLAPLQCR